MKAILIGLDGATFKVIDPLVREGKLPTIEHIIKKGVYGKLESTFPPLTGPAWTALATGKNPGKTGVFGFFNRKDKTTEPKYITSDEIRRGGAYWDCLSNTGMKTGIFNYPMLYPPYPINGFMISGLGRSPEEDFTYPEHLKRDLIKVCNGYAITVPFASSRYKEKPATFVKDTMKLLSINEKAILYLLRNYEMDVFTVVISATDFAMHYMWKYIDEKHPLHNKKEALNNKPAFTQIWQRTDRVLESIVNSIDQSTNIFIVSDHGSGALKQSFFTNSWLEKEGYLYRHHQPRVHIQNLVRTCIDNVSRSSPWLKNMLLGAVRRGKKYVLPFATQIDMSKTLAFATSHDYVSGEIYINLHKSQLERYKTVQAQIRQRLQEFFTSLNTKINVYFPEDIYTGPYVDLAPDILFEIDNFACSVHYTFNNDVYQCFPPNPNISGTHRRDGIFIACGPDIKQGIEIEDARIYDIAPTLLHMLHQPVPLDMDGRTLIEIFRDGSEPAKRKIVYQEAATEQKIIKSKVKSLKDAGKL